MSEWASQEALRVKGPPACRAGDVRKQELDPWVGKMPWGRHGHPLQASCLENPGDRGPGGPQSTGSRAPDAAEVTQQQALSD